MRQTLEFTIAERLEQEYAGRLPSEQELPSKGVEIA